MGSEIRIRETQDQKASPLNKRFMGDSKRDRRFGRRSLCDTAEACRSATESRNDTVSLTTVFAK